MAAEKGAVGSNAPLSYLAPRTSYLVSKDPRVLLLDLRHLRQHSGRIVGQELDLRERRAVGGLLHVGMQRALAAEVHEHLLDLRRVDEVLEHARGVRVRGLGEDR